MAGLATFTIVRKEEDTMSIKLSLREKSGFTLVEILLVAALIAITATISFSFMKPWLALYRLKIAVRQVAADMQLARLRAVSTNDRYRVVFDVNNNQYDLKKCVTDDCDTANDTVEKDNQELPKGIVFGYKSGAQGPPGGPTGAITDSVTFSSDRASFSPKGTAGQGTVYIKNENDDTVAVTVAESSTGLIRLYHLKPGTTNDWEQIS